MKVLGIFWGIVGPLLFLFCLGMNTDAENEQRAYMAKCRMQNAAPGELDHFRTAAPIDRYCWDKFLAEH